MLSQFGLDPLSSGGDDGAEGDLDQDGLTNFQEQIFWANPLLVDSDGDGTSDGSEVTQGSFPNDTSDGGLPPNASEMLTVRIIVGDPSGSHSERWRVEVVDMATDTTILNHQSPSHGELSTNESSTFNQFRKGHSYELNLMHVATDPTKDDPDFYPDYDWALEVSVQDDDGNFVDVAETTATGKPFVVIDPWDPVIEEISDTIPLLVNRDELRFPWEGDPDRTQQYEDQIASKRVLLLKMDIGSQTEEAFKNKSVYRGDPLRNWSSHSTDLNIPNTNVSLPISAHPTLGDYVHYKAYHPGIDSSVITNYKWSAVPATGYNNLTTIEGPNDASASEWKIEDGGVDWKSGIYDITLELTFNGGTTAEVTKEQTVWQRTDDVLVVAYIDENIPAVAGGGSAHAILSDGNVGQDMDYLLSPGSRVVFFGQVGFTNVYKTPFEPDVARRHLNRFVLAETANEQPPERFQVDLSPTLSVYDEAEINSFFSNNTNYRAINRIQAEYLLDESGDIVQGPEIITKLAYGTNIGNTPDFPWAPDGIFDTPWNDYSTAPEKHPDSGVINTDGSTYDFHHVTHAIGVPQGFAQYASGRVGNTGQQMNQEINGSETPWIYGLIEFEGDAYGPEHSEIVRQIFPTYWIYVNGNRVNNFPQSDPELFIQLGNSL
jgi:hypothetical protein